jgi:hypothetical protein
MMWMQNSILHTQYVLALGRCMLRLFRAIFQLILASVYMVMIRVCTLYRLCTISNIVNIFEGLLWDRAVEPYEPLEPPSEAPEADAPPSEAPEADAPPPQPKRRPHRAEAVVASQLAEEGCPEAVGAPLPPLPPPPQSKQFLPGPISSSSSSSSSGDGMVPRQPQGPPPNVITAPAPMSPKTPPTEDMSPNSPPTQS